MRNVIVILILGGLLALGVGNAWVAAGEKPVPPNVKELEKKSGKELYKSTCKPCHLPESPAGEYTPMTLIQEQWERFFEKKYASIHDALVDSTSTEDTDWMTPEMRERLRWMTPKMLEKIRKFAIDGAADSEHPMTCG